MQLALASELDLDVDVGLRFSARAIAVLGSYVELWRDQQRRVMQSVETAPRALDVSLASRMDEAALLALKQRSPADIGLYFTCLRWTALRQAEPGCR